MAVGTPAAFAAGGSEVYVAAANYNGDAAYMILNPDGTFSDPVDMLLPYPLSTTGSSYGNGIGDFDNDGDLDYITALGRLVRPEYKFYSNIYIFEKLDSLDQVAQFAYVEKEDEEPGGSAWTIDGLPGDMAVADFNGDGNLDFVLNHYRTPHCGLYLGNGHLGFDFQLLSVTTPDDSIGVDAADFNNDGKADFVIAPNIEDEPLYVYLGNGDGTFEQKTSDRDPSDPSLSKEGYGIAAGDFVGRDGIVDLVVSDTGLLEIYEGDGEGNFSFYSRREHSSADPFPMNRSTLDNIDFDGDGDQDLVVANFGDESAGVAVLELIDDQGNFEHSGTYLGGISGSRKAVTALPYLSNKKPVAILTPETISVKVGEPVEWDAAESYDEDGTIVSYEWDYGDGVVSPLGVNTLAKSSTDDNSGGPQSSYVYSDSGTYFVTLTVTDDQGATDTVQAEVHVQPLSVSVYFSPSKLNLKSREKWITATLTVPSGYDARMIDPDSLSIVLEGKAEFKAHSLYRHGLFCKHYQKRSRKIRYLRVKFDRQALIEALDGATGETILNVTGLISSNASDAINFSGAGTIQVYEKKRKIRYYRMYIMKLIMRFFS
jgi:PKD repeat protein